MKAIRMMVNIYTRGKVTWFFLPWLVLLLQFPVQDVRLTDGTSISATNDNSLPTIQALAQQLTFLDTAYRLDLTAQQTKALVAPPDLAVVRTQQNQVTRPAGEFAAGFALAFAGMILIFVSVTIYANMVAAGVAEEKSSRMMEILLNAATPFQPLAGKIVGIGAACLTQMGRSASRRFSCKPLCKPLYLGHRREA